MNSFDIHKRDKFDREDKQRPAEQRVDFFVPENAQNPPHEQIARQLSFVFPEDKPQSRFSKFAGFARAAAAGFAYSFKLVPDKFFPKIKFKFGRAKFSPTPKFRMSFLLVPFTIIVLVLGSIIGTRFINFASSVSLSNNGVYQNVANSIGAILGTSIPALKNLDQSSLADAIRGKERVNILLLGYGGGDHQGADLTDTLMLMNIDFATNKVSLISIPRDTWTVIPTIGNQGSYWKINAAYALGLDDRDYPNKLQEFSGPAGGGNLAKFEISKIVGMPVDYFLAVDFSGFQKIVDTLGGVTVTVDNAFTDYSYPVSDENINGEWCVAPDNSQTVCRYKEVHFDAGTQFMDGERALEFARSRHAAGIEGSDFARARRQQKLLVAIEQKALSINAVPKVLELMSDIQGHFQTDLSLAEIKDLASYVSKIDLNAATRLSIDDNNLLVQGTSADGQYILTPAAGQEDFGQIQTYIFNSINGITKAPKTKTSQEAVN